MGVKIPFVPRPKASKSVPHFTNTHNIYTFSSAIAIGLGPLAPMAILPGPNAPKPTAGTGPCTILEVDRNLVSKFQRVCILVMFRARGLRVRIPACAQWCIFSIVRANFEKYDLCSAPIARALPRYIVPFFKFFKTGKCFKTMLFPVSNPRHMQKHCLKGVKSVQQYRSSWAQTV